MVKRVLIMMGLVVLIFASAILIAGQTSASSRQETEDARFFFPLIQSRFRPALKPFVEGLDQPVVVTGMVDPGDGRLLIAMRDGRVHLSSAEGVIQTDLLLDIRDKVFDDGNEMGLLGLAVHPEFESNGFLFVFYTEKQVDDIGGESYFSVIARYTVASETADLESELRLLRIPQQTRIHHAGAMHFGPLDGYLYIAIGDGGTDGSYSSFAQETDSYLGKILRIDVDSGSPYAIPEDNPFVNDPDSLGEIWQLGLRNPWRFSFDRETGDMYIGDVGEFTWEEINYVPASSKGGENFGWPCMEGPVVFRERECKAPSSYTEPIFTYPHSPCGSVIAGYLYRGTEMPLLKDMYILADFCYGSMWAIQRTDDQVWYPQSFGNYHMGFTTFGERFDGELLIAAGSDPTIYMLTTPE